MSLSLPIILAVFALGVFTGIVFTHRRCGEHDHNRDSQSDEILRAYEEYKRNQNRLEAYNNKRNMHWL